MPFKALNNARETKAPGQVKSSLGDLNNRLGKQIPKLINAEPIAEAIYYRDQ
jgi:hypothetical protein